MTYGTAFEAPADILVVSDLHAMSPDVDVARFRHFVESHPAKRLVLAGDTLDLYMWRHAKKGIDEAGGMAVMEFLIELAEIGVDIVILPGNHDQDWAWVGQDVVVSKRKREAKFPDGMKALMVELVEFTNVHVANKYSEDDTVIVHGHEGWQGDWLWRMSDAGDKLTRHKMVGGTLRRKVMGKAPLKLRAAAVRGHGFYRRLAAWGRKVGKHHVIHGHTHCEGRRTRKDVVLDGLPAWRPSEGEGGGMVCRKGVWERVAV